MKSHRLLSLISTLLVGCGGGGPEQPASPTTPERLPAGRYDARLEGSEFGDLMQNGDGAAIYVTRARMAYGTWDYSSSRASIAMTSLSQPVDDLGNEFPSAKSGTRTDQYSVAKSGGNWSGTGIVLTPDSNGSAPAIPSIPRNWRFRNLYRFGDEFLDYTIQVDIDSAGTLSGFDVNGCVFTGSLAQLSGTNLYRVEIHASQCGATNRYIENASYTGYASVGPGPAQGQTTLYAAAVDRARALGISVQLFAQ